jgi:hypothetical protein
MTMTGIRRLSENEWSSPEKRATTSCRHRSDDMRNTDSGAKSPNETVEPSGKTIHNARWRFEWSNLKNNRRFPL